MGRVVHREATVVCSVCRMLPGLGALGPAWICCSPCCPCCQDGARLWSRAGTQLPPLLPGGLGWGWAGGQEMLDLMPRDSLGSKKIPWAGWVEGVAQGRLCLCPPSAQPPSQQQEEPLGCLGDTNISAEGSGRGSQSHGGCSLLGWVSQTWGSDPLGRAARLQGALNSPRGQREENAGLWGHPVLRLPAHGFLPSASSPRQFSQRKSPESTSGG